MKGRLPSLPLELVEHDLPVCQAAELVLPARHLADDALADLAGPLDKEVVPLCKIENIYLSRMVKHSQKLHEIGLEARLGKLLPPRGLEEISSSLLVEHVVDEQRAQSPLVVALEGADELVLAHPLAVDDLRWMCPAVFSQKLCLLSIACSPHEEAGIVRLGRKRARTRSCAECARLLIPEDAGIRSIYLG